PLNGPNETHLEITDNEVNEAHMLGQETGLATIVTQLRDLTGTMQTLVAEREHERRNHDLFVQQPPPPPQVNLISKELLESLRIIIPRYDGGYPLGWIFQLCRNAPVNDWDCFVKALNDRFKPPENKDFQGQLSKLRKPGSVTDYYDQFAALSNHVNGLPVAFLLSCFISGLRPEIQTEVASFAPFTISCALALAKVQENKLSQLRSQPRIYSSYPSLLPTPSTLIPTSPKTTTSKLPFRRLTQSEMAARREKGLYGDQFEFRTYEDPIGGSVTSLTGVPYPHTLRDLQLPISPTNSFPVMVGNGDHLHCKGVCLGIPLRIQDYSAKVDLYLLPIKGADLGLGVQWLLTVGPHWVDYSNLTLQDLFVDLPDILTSFTSLFSSVPRLPPHHETDHRIHLIPSTTPINVRPYRYPHYQNDIMEKIVSEMLTAGIIEPSTSPFSSPVILVSKKTGDWRFCIDYRALNEVTVKDRFPIPTINEFIDELH
ncbi:ty3-gypsy retrotransposon protein, partial [Tanacetum coccineum]